MVNTARSALSSVFSAEKGTPFNKHPFIARLLRLMFKQRPSLLRSLVTYDVAKVLRYINNSHSQMSLECLTKNLATLMGILNGQRSLTLTLLNTNYMPIDENHCISFKKLQGLVSTSLLWNSGDTLTNLYVLSHILSSVC